MGGNLLRGHFRAILRGFACLVIGAQALAFAGEASLTATGKASWYGEDHRGRLMANGHPFDPDKLTAASWFYPLGARLLVTSRTPHSTKQVIVTVTDRGPAKRLVRHGRIIDLTHEAFRRLANPDLGLIAVEVRPIADTEPGQTQIARN